MANIKPSEPHVKNTEVDSTNIFTSPGITLISRKHKKHLVYMAFENDKYNIHLFRRYVASAFKDKATDVMFDQSFTFIIEPVEFDQELFRDISRIRPRRRLSPKFGSGRTVKSFRCIADGCRQQFLRKDN
ncbi:hypothetical protein RF11_07677 [Thelohanellus kitauei]|uniref:Uncharacterized protein n=1 Tax=Thelohanellus kitauei TaxID=669202 RepID=A0A0C2N0D8_THEKT|nr:hypothetical protein RF11_07677 [Thelohanellus kitauei]